MAKNNSFTYLLSVKQYKIFKEILMSKATYNVFNAGRQSGKDLRNDSILYYDGYVGTIGDCNIGDNIFGDDGQLTTIVDKYPQGLKAQYRLTLADGRTINCGLEHQHQLISKNGTLKVVDTQYIIDNYLSSRGKPEHCYIPTAKAVNYSEKKHLIHPYVMGILIAEGSLSNGGVSFSSGDLEVVDKVKDLTSFEIRQLNDYDYRIKTNGVYNRELRRLGLTVKSNMKFIPDEYLFDSIDNRIELLKGLMDGDGTISINGGMQYFTVSNRLNDTFISLVRGLGLKANTRIKKTEYTYKGVKLKGQDCNRISLFSNDINPFHLTRKRNRFKSNPKFNYHYKTAVANVEQIEDAKSTCITVDNNSSCFLTDGYTITHNTLIMSRVTAVLAITKPNIKILVATPYSSQVDTYYENLIAIEGISDFIEKDKGHPYRTIKLKNGSVIDFRTTDNPKSVRSKSYSYIFLDEFAFMKEEAFNLVIGPTLIASGNDAQLYFLSSPKGLSGLFYDLAHKYKGNPDYRRWDAFYEINPRANMKFIESERLRMPKPEFRQEYLGLFEAAGGDVFEGLKKVLVLKEFPDFVEGARYYVGIDWGKSNDSTVVVILNEDREVVFVKEFGGDWIIQGNDMATYLNKFKPYATMAESNGVGAFAIDNLNDKYGGGVEDFFMSNSSKKEIISDLRASIMLGDIKLPDVDLCEKMFHQISNYTYSKTKTGLLTYHHRPGEHDDYVDALAIANYCYNQNHCVFDNFEVGYSSDFHGN